MFLRSVRQRDRDPDRPGEGAVPGGGRPEAGTDTQVPPRAPVLHPPDTPHVLQLPLAGASGL